MSNFSSIKITNVSAQAIGIDNMPSLIRGEKGLDGSTPQRGVDYWTDEDRAAIEAATAAANTAAGEANEAAEHANSKALYAFSKGSDARIAAQSASTAADAANAAAESANEAASHTPYIGENGNWYIWDTGTAAYIDTARPSGGAAGSPGANGEDGDDGKSAYQLAVDNGFVGTEAEWLSSLHASVTIAQATGQSQTSVMSQKAVTDAINAAVAAQLNTGV